MSPSPQSTTLPPSTSPDLQLGHPTPEERLATWASISSTWRDALTVPQFLEESQYLTSVPLAKNDGMTNWILADLTLPPNLRRVLCSCETFRKRAFVSDAEGHVEEGIVHGVASVYCVAEYRGRGYPKRMMLELARILCNWQVKECEICIGSILYSDIGKHYYAPLGWRANATNFHLVFQPSSLSSSSSPPSLPNMISSKPILGVPDDLGKLCKLDEEMIRKEMGRVRGGSNGGNKKLKVSVIPDFEHMLWHISKEEFVGEKIFGSGNYPATKGAIAGEVGKRIWIVWTHRYYNLPEAEASNNTLYVLRLVIEDQAFIGNCAMGSGKEENKEDEYYEQVCSLTAVLNAAQAEAAEWKLDQVKLKEPTVLVQQMIRDSGINFEVIEREEDSIASGLWYGEDGVIGEGETPEWLNNEHYSWC